MIEPKCELYEFSSKFLSDDKLLYHSESDTNFDSCPKSSDFLRTGCPGWMKVRTPVRQIRRPEGKTAFSTLKIFGGETNPTAAGRKSGSDLPHLSHTADSKSCPSPRFSRRG
jgi:hypothetical protein